MSVDQYLQNLEADDPYVVRDAATELGKTRDKAFVAPLISAFDEGGYSAYEKRPQDLEGKRSFGAYRDKVITIAEALWMIGAEEGINAAKSMLEETIRDGEILRNMKRGAFRQETALIDFFENSTPYSENWQNQVKPMDMGQVKSNEKSGGCFIATAALGTSSCQEIATLYRWRDDVLLKCLPGKLFVKAYYFVSPSVAKRIERSFIAQRLVSNWLIKPWCTIVNRLWPENSD